ncbi:TIGR01440 family protein [Lysinibacillus yapensis]|uniref:UPF0340 protein D1B33_03945 n=1 Tax=Ureibacillus yapensis TaxID=2304605 RepID=A0A396SKW2_9BACL|nr:TIGR01440 family protein [Lysinibacillus yapensis]RHW40009.1 TIGR01440 family protein [Lysinibacillus yapensis]
MTSLEQIQSQLSQLLNELEEHIEFQPKQLFVIGCSTSEIAGARIGTSGAMEIAEVLYKEFSQFAKKHDIYLAFQGCEHINRAITMEYEAALTYSLEPVSVVPVKQAGGSMAAHAYTQLERPVVVEHARAHAGIDIGQTIIGMHLKEVVIPVRTSIRQIGEAIVTVARTRPKLIGGERAVYK